jgi:hypothetical protein
MIPFHGDPFLYSALAFITSFVIALFFISAGLTYNGDKHRRNLKNYAISRGRQLLIPYFIIYIIMTLLFIPLTGTIDTYLTPGDLFFWLLYGAGPPNQPTYLWFLPVLYLGLILFTILESLTHSKDPRILWVFVILLPLIAFWITDVMSPILVPWRINSVFVATAFCIIGHEMQRVRGLKWWRTTSRLLDAVIVVGLSVVTILISQFNGFVSHPDDWFGVSGWLYMVSGTLGTIVFFIISSQSDSTFISRKMQFLGVNSQIVYEVHPMFFYLVPVLLSVFGLPVVEYMASFTLFWPVRFIFALGISIPITMLVLRSRILSMVFTGKGVVKQRPPPEQFT